MHRRTFLIRTGGLMISVAGLGAAHAARSATDRVGMGTVIFRNRFEQTKPKAVTVLGNPLTLLDVPGVLPRAVRHPQSRVLEQSFRVARDAVSERAAGAREGRRRRAHQCPGGCHLRPGEHERRRSASGAWRRCASGSMPRPC